MPRTRAPRNFEVLSLRRRGFSTSRSPGVGSAVLANSAPSIILDGTPQDPYALRSPIASDKFIDPSAANDLGSGTEANPWKTLTSARANTLQPGQHLWIKAGTITSWPSLLSLPSGTAQNRIVIAAYPGQTPTIIFPTAGLSSLDGYPGFGSPGGTAYWSLHGLNFEVPGMCGILFGIHQWNLQEVNCSNIRVVDCTGHTSVATSDNAGILFFDGGADYIEVVRCNFNAAGATGGDGRGNRALIWTDFSTYFSLIGCILDADGVSLPFYHKHSNFQAAGTTQRIFKNNIIMNGSRGALFCGRYFQITNNVFRNVNLDFADQGGFDVGRGLNTVRHNTFYITVGNNFGIQFVNNDGGSAAGENFDNVFADNVVTQTGFLWDGATSGVDIRTVSNNNVYDNGSSEIRRVNTFYSLAGYKSAFPTREINSIAGNITFSGGSSMTTNPSQWALTGAGRNAASDGTDCGVDASKLLTVN